MMKTCGIEYRPYLLLFAYKPYDHIFSPQGKKMMKRRKHLYMSHTNLVGVKSYLKPDLFHGVGVDLALGLQRSWRPRLHGRRPLQTLEQ
jgi:hypothetical protein